MKWNRFFINVAMLLCTMSAAAADSIAVEETPASKYERRMQKKQETWASLVPTHFVIQNAGNMGVVSLGVGWSFGKKHQWEADFMFSYIPKHQSSRGKLTNTIKGNFIPWHIKLNPKADSDAKCKWSLEPFTTSLYINTVYGHEFWRDQPGRYPSKYYEFMSTKFRLNLALGQRLTLDIPKSKRQMHNRITFFYEVSTCDLYVRSMFQSSVPLKDVLGLSLGLKFYNL